MLISRRNVFNFGLRARVVAPLLISFLLLVLLSNTYVINKLVDDEKKRLFENQLKILKATETNLGRLIIANDFAELYATLHQLELETEGWEKLVVVNNQNRRIYPFSDPGNPSSEYIAVLKYKMNIGNEDIGTVSLWYNWRMQYQQIKEYINRLILLLLLAVSIAIVFTGFWLDRIVRKPVVGLSKVANALANGNYEARLPRVTKDEVGELIHSFNSMRHNLQIKQQEILMAKDVAESASQAKSEFLARMSHELRTPLNAILGFSQLLQTDIENPLNNEQKESVREISRAGDHLLELINEILELSKIETGQISLSQEPVKLVDLLQACVSMVSPLALERNIVIEEGYDNEHQKIEINVDYTRFKQVIVNLMSNAIKYNKNKGKISLSIKEKGDELVSIGVTDQGKGLTAEEISKIFTPFDRLGREMSDIEGAGIGMTITKTLVEAMGGSIDIESTPGNGSTFWVTIHKVLTMGVSEPQPVIESEKDELDDSSDEKKSTTSKTILYVDDNPRNIELFEKIIKADTNYKLLTATSAINAFEALKITIPDLMVIDINLPEINGIELLEIFKSKPETKSIPGIALSANAIQRDIEKAMDAGFAHYVTKPFHKDELIETIDSLIIESSRKAG